MKRLYFFVFILFIILTISFLVRSKSESVSTLGNYYGVSKDKTWEASLEVYESNNETLLKGNIICLDDKIIENLDKEDIRNNQIILFKSNGNSFGGNYIYDKNKFTIINTVRNDGAIYEKVLISIGSYKIELDLQKKD